MWHQNSEPCGIENINRYLEMKYEVKQKTKTVGIPTLPNLYYVIEPY